MRGQTIKCEKCLKPFVIKWVRRNSIQRFCSKHCVLLGTKRAKGYKHSLEAIEKIKKHCLKTNSARFLKPMFGSSNPAWRGGISTYENKVRHNRARQALKIINGGNHTISEWEALKMKFRYMCLCCKKTEPEITLTKDHIIPVTKGGSNAIDNIQPLCQSCNSIKSVKIINYIKILC